MSNPLLLLPPVADLPPLPAKAPMWQRWAHRVVGHIAFQFSVVVAIVLNAFAIGAQTFDLPYGLDIVVEGIDEAFLIIFVIELVLRFLAAGARPTVFFSNGWNIFDTVVIGAACLPMLLTNSTLLRLVRVLRVARLSKVMPDLSVLLDGLRRAARPALSLLALTTLLCFLYGMVGYLLFHEVAPQYFGNIGIAMLTLFELLTLEGWNTTLHDLMDVSGIVAVVYTVGFVMFGTYVVLNLLVGVVINSLDDAYKLRQLQRRGEAAPQVAVSELEDLLSRLRVTLDEIEQREARLERQLERTARMNRRRPLKGAPHHHGTPRHEHEDGTPEPELRPRREVDPDGGLPSDRRRRMP